ncbi:MAG: hypothetical protein WC334_05315 [Kiritimatiellales bacterium]
MKIPWMILAAGAVISSVYANPITTLFNTGVASNDTNGAPATLTADGAADAHYTLTVAPAGAVTTGPYVTTQGTFPLNGPWLADSSASKWISPQASYPSTSVVDPEGNYTYTTSFDLTGFDLATVIIDGKIAVDNSISSIRLNGNSISFSPASTSFTNFGTFAVSAGSQSLLTTGMNTFEFNVINAAGTAGNPGGLRVELSGVANTIPEPAAMSMMVMVCAAALWIRRRFID